MLLKHSTVLEYKLSASYTATISYRQTYLWVFGICFSICLKSIKIVGQDNTINPMNMICLFDFSLNIHSKHLKSCWDGVLQFRPCCQVWRRGPLD